MFKRKYKKELMEDISNSIKSIREDITLCSDANENKTRAEAIAILIKAYRMI